MTHRQVVERKLLVAWCPKSKRYVTVSTQGYFSRHGGGIHGFSSCPYSDKKPPYKERFIETYVYDKFVSRLPQEIELERAAADAEAAQQQEADARAKYAEEQKILDQIRSQGGWE